MKDMMTNENLLMDHNSLRWVAQSNYNSFNNAMERWRPTWLTISLLVPLAKKASPSCEEISCDQVDPFPPVGVFVSEWILDSEPRTKNSCFATSYPGPWLYALLPVARRRLRLLKVDSSTKKYHRSSIVWWNSRIFCKTQVNSLPKLKNPPIFIKLRK